MQDRLVVRFQPLRPPGLEPAAEPAVASEASGAFMDTIPPPIIEHILSQLLHVCGSPGAVRIDCLHYLLTASRTSLSMHTLPAQVVCAMCVCRSWYAAGGVVFNAAMASASLQLRCTLPTQQCVSGAAVFACCEEGLGEGPLSMEECVALSVPHPRIWVTNFKRNGYMVMFCCSCLRETCLIGSERRFELTTRTHLTHVSHSSQLQSLPSEFAAF